MKNDYEIRGDITAIFLKRRDGTVLETLINTSDLEKAKEFDKTWCCGWSKKTNSFYVTGKRVIEGKGKTVSLHRWIMNEPKDLCVDHINHDTLNNTRGNLRILTSAQNLQNYKGARQDNQSGIRGVTKHYKKWQATLRVNHKYIYLGTFEDIKQAEQTVIEARKKYMPFSLEAMEG